LNLFLNMVDPNHLIGLSLASNGLSADGLKQLAPVLLNFHALQALDLSHNAINFSSSTEICELLGAIVRKLPNLQRLSLAGNPVGPRLRRIFRSVQPKFIYLSLTADTALTAIDLHYLKQHFCANLKELDLSGNALDNDEYHVMHFFETSVFPNLESLSLVECRLSDQFFRKVSAIIRENRRINFLNLFRNHFSHSQIVENLPKFGASRTLQTLKLSFPFDYLAILDEEFDDAGISIALNHIRVEWSQSLALIGDHVGRRKPLELLLS